MFLFLSLNNLGTPFLKLFSPYYRFSNLKRRFYKKRKFFIYITAAAAKVILKPTKECRVPGAK